MLGDNSFSWKSRAPPAAIVGVIVTEQCEVFFDVLGTSRKAQNVPFNTSATLVTGPAAAGSAQAVQPEGVVDEPRGADTSSAFSHLFRRVPRRLAASGVGRGFLLSRHAPVATLQRLLHRPSRERRVQCCESEGGPDHVPPTWANAALVRTRDRGRCDERFRTAGVRRFALEQTDRLRG